jgi:predicted nucleic acid-binding protein
LKYLVDTNIWLELLLEQEKAESVRQFFEKTNPQSLAITEFSLYSICIILCKLNKDGLLADFIKDTIEDSGVLQVRLALQDIKEIIAIRSRFYLDFDDAYQYAAASKMQFELVSFDSDFDRTDRGRKTPADLVV